ncbi:MAG: hypothetical protein ACR2NP_04835 [Pirellulaceae bacterium]
MKPGPTLCLLVLLLSFITSKAIAVQTSAPERATAIDFTIGGVGIDSTLEELRERLPTSVEGHAPNAVPMQDNQLVVINNGANQVPTAYFRLLDKAVISIEVHYTALGVNEIAANQPMIDQFVERFGDYEKTWRNDNLDGGVDIFVWESDTRFVSFAMHDDGNARLYISGKNHPQLYPPETPRTSILGIDPPLVPENRR